MSDRRVGGGRRRNDSVDNRGVMVRGLVTCAVIIALGLSISAVLSAHAAETTASRRPIVADALDVTARRQDCFNNLLAGYARAVSDAVAASRTANTAEQDAAIRRIDAAARNLENQRAICVDPFPMPDAGPPPG
jgi:hypothetical protein